MCREDVKYIHASGDIQTETLNISADEIIAIEIDLKIESQELMIKIEGDNYLSYGFDGNLKETIAEYNLVKGEE